MSRLPIAITTWRKRLGARFLVQRDQEKHWNRSAAARQAKIDPNTLKRIERGQNVEIESMERYAVALGRPLESWIRDVLCDVATERGDIPPQREHDKPAAVGQRRSPAK